MEVTNVMLYECNLKNLNCVVNHWLQTNIVLFTARPNNKFENVSFFSNFDTPILFSSISKIVLSHVSL